MPLDNRETALVRESFEALKPSLEDASVDFYEHFFAHDPEAPTLFRTDIADQGMRFMSAVGTILDHLDRPAEAEETIARLGAGHAAIGIAPGHYAPMRTALIETFREHLGTAFTEEHAAAWAKAFDEIAAGMLAAGGDPAPQRPA